MTLTTATTRIITVAAAKGVGKTTLAYELAAGLGVLIDLDWDAGGATRMWGTTPPGRLGRRSSMRSSAARTAGRPAQRRANQPELVPAHPDLSASRIDADLVADCLAAWAPQWGRRYVVVDTHPGANALTDGAMQTADLVVVPVVLGAREMDALEAIVADYAGYRILLVPTMVPSVPPGASSSGWRASPTGGSPWRRRSPTTAGSPPPAPVGARHPAQPGRACAPPPPSSQRSSTRWRRPVADQPSGIDLMGARMERASRRPPPPRRAASAAPPVTTVGVGERRRPRLRRRPWFRSARHRPPRERGPDGGGAGAPGSDLPPVNLAIRVRKPLDDRLAELIHALRRDGVRTSKVELIEMLLWELPRTTPRRP